MKEFQDLQAAYGSIRLMLDNKEAFGITSLDEVTLMDRLESIFIQAYDLGHKYGKTVYEDDDGHLAVE